MSGSKSPTSESLIWHQFQNNLPSRVLEAFSPELIDEIVKNLVNGLHPEQIILFGSYAYGKPNQDSDLDLLIVMAASQERCYRLAQKAYKSLNSLCLMIPVDLVVVSQLEVDAKRTVFVQPTKSYALNALLQVK